MQELIACRLGKREAQAFCCCCCCYCFLFFFFSDGEIMEDPCLRNQVIFHDFVFSGVTLPFDITDEP